MILVVVPLVLMRGLPFKILAITLAILGLKELIDLRKNNITGKELEERLEKIDIITNKNAIPFDTENKKTTSGLRIGTAAVTSRGMKEEDMLQLAIIISSVIKMDKDTFDAAIPCYKNLVADLAFKYPLYKMKN